MQVEMFDQYLAYLGNDASIIGSIWDVNRNSYVVCRMVPFSMTLNDFTACVYLTLNISDRDIVPMEY